MNWREYIEKKDKSVLIGQIIGILLIILSFVFVLWFETEVNNGKFLGFSIVACGLAFGWATGMILSPQVDFNDEKTNFTKVQQLIVTFVTGALAVKLLPLITKDSIIDLFNDHVLITRIFYFLTSFILSAIVIYYDRVYLQDQDKAKLSFRYRDLMPESNIKIPINTINDTYRIKLYNRGTGSLELWRENDLGVGGEPFNILPGDCGNIQIIHLGLNGNFLAIYNRDSKALGKFKLRIS